MARHPSGAVDEEVAHKRATSVLQVFDVKSERLLAALAGAPKIGDSLCDACRAHFDAVKAYLDAYGVPYVLDPALVRGLDYYTRTTFEFLGPEENVNSSICGGGRYDGLVEAVGGSSTPGVGFGAGLERLLLAMEREGATAEPPRLDLFVAFEEPELRGRLLPQIAKWRAEGRSVDTDYAGRSMKGQLTQAQRLGAKTVVVARADGRTKFGGVGRTTASCTRWRSCRWPGATRCAASCGPTTPAGRHGRRLGDTRRDHGGLVFVDLRDAAGKVQLVLNPERSPGAAGIAHEIRNEFVLQATGEVVARAPELVNPNLPTGQIEVQVDELRILSRSTPLPFQLDEENVDETLRLRYRWLDLRRERLQRNIRLRGQMVGIMRRTMEAAGFVDIQTPVLWKPTPEGARDFLVPARLQPAHFYALPQSPQIAKQLLVIAGFERYYQVAVCFRDEDLRADRVQEITQLDVEMAFPDYEELVSAHGASGRSRSGGSASASSSSRRSCA